jgi:NAD(P)-dependent dehydrogenase (short-subunit alcohol dehydrogenase family)
MESEGAKKLEGKVALITGASKGIGKAVAAAYAKEGASVFVCARNDPQLKHAIGEIRAGARQGQIHGVAADVGKADDARRLVSEVQQRFGAIQILVNNASLLGPRAPIVEYPISAWEEVIRVNLTGPFLMIREALRVMIPRHEGSIINVSSGVGRVGRARWGAYCASKFGLEGLTQLTADEVREFGIRVNAVNPGPTRTQMRATAYPEEDPLTLPAPEEITGVFVYLASDESSTVTGKSLDAGDWSKRSNSAG